MARKKKKGTELDVFLDSAGRANVYFLNVLAKESPQSIKQLLKQIRRFRRNLLRKPNQAVHRLQDQATSGKPN